MSFSKKDKEQLEARGISLGLAQDQIDRFKKGFPPTKLLAPCSIGNGIRKLSDTELDEYVELYAAESLKYEIVKFVPASGAATRMFEALYNDEAKHQNARNQVVENLSRFAFYGALKTLAKKHKIDIEELASNNPQHLFNLIVGDEGLGYGKFPKGLVPFHVSDGVVRTAFEEHLVEASSYGMDAEGFAKVHFTVQESWLANVRKFLRKAAGDVSVFGAEGFELSYSVQSPATDTLAVTLDNEVARDENGNLIFRPAGHGALLTNLNQIDADIVFVKNIDNVVSDKHIYHTRLYKSAMGGLAIELMNKIYKFCKKIDQGRVPVGVRNEMKNFCQNELLIEVPKVLLDRYHKRDLMDWYYHQFSKPLRICGMVINEGEPGGGPFWVEDSSGRKSLQIVEKAQIDLEDAEQRAILESSTHFNPVDLVCVLKNYEGDFYDLTAFVDHETGFISQKSYNGKPIKAMELPGLWNGSMALWNTVFVEVPATTFSPVKTINDLLKPLHQ
jgi:hypothetical protein